MDVPLLYKVSPSQFYLTLLSKVRKKLGDFFSNFCGLQNILTLRKDMGRKSKYVHTFRDFWRLYMQRWGNICGNSGRCSIDLFALEKWTFEQNFNGSPSAQ